MCEFISWIEYRGEVVYLTDEDLNTEKGKELLNYIQDPNDICGHGAIRYFYDIPCGQGTDREVTNLSSPDKLPQEIVKAVKEGRMSAIGYSETLLNNKGLKKLEAIEQPTLEKYEAIKEIAWKKYEAIKEIAWKKYKAIERPAWEKFEAIEQSALEKYEYEATKETAYKKYDAKVDSARKKYYATERSAYKKYEAIKEIAYKKYKAIEQPAFEEYKATKQTTFWKVFKDKKNRQKAWR